MDRGKRFHIYQKMKKEDILSKALELADVAESMRDWIDSVPKDIELPVMPGFDRDWADRVIDK